MRLPAALLLLASVPILGRAERINHEGRILAEARGPGANLQNAGEGEGE